MNWVNSANKQCSTAIQQIAVCLLLGALIMSHSHAADWVKLQEVKGAKLMLDKQSVLETNGLKRAWIKITYSTPQINPEIAEKTYNLSKLLWFFDCTKQQSATAQVFQYSDEELIYSAAVESKLAKFTEPVPETEIDVAMRHVCGISTLPEAPTAKPVAASPAKKADTVEAKSTEAVAESAKPAEAEKPEAASKAGEQKATDKKDIDKKDADKKAPAAANKDAETAKAGEAKSAADKKPTDGKEDPTKAPASKDEPVKPADAAKPKPEAKTVTNKRWTYNGKEGPENWGQLTADYATCETGKNQSPINIDKAIPTPTLKPFKKFQRFPAHEVVNLGQNLQINFKQGNMMVLDSVVYHLRYIGFHAPSEHTIGGKHYPMEAQFVHVDETGKQAVMAVMFEEGAANSALTRIWQQMSGEKGVAQPLKGRVVPSELTPQNTDYYRFSGSLTTPPCNEGVSWVMMKTPMTASKIQLEAFKNVMGVDNNRPIQPLNGRMVVVTGH